MLTAREHEEDLPQTIGTVAELLEDIVQRQIVSDVPLCSLLSGGLDSSAVTAMAHRAIAARQGGRIRSFSVDFTNHGAAFVASNFHKASDTPFVRDFVAHVGCDHTEVVLDSRELASRDLSRAVLQAADFPLSTSGDMFSSLYRLFQAVRAESTVALSGESSDEVFGGYHWFHDPKAVDAATFPWLSGIVDTFDGTQVLDADLLDRLNLPEFQADSYVQAVAETPVVKGERPGERRMREITYLHLTRFVQFLLDRKDRMSMAVGLEVRVPFCDHRLVDYVVQHPLASQDVRRPGKEHFTRCDPRTVAQLHSRTAEESISFDTRSGLRESCSRRGRRDSGGPIPSRKIFIQPEDGLRIACATVRNNELARRTFWSGASALAQRVGERLRRRAGLVACGTVGHRFDTWGRVVAQSRQKRQQEMRLAQP